MRIRFDSENPELFAKGRDIFYWLLKNQEDKHDESSNNSNEIQQPRRVHEESILDRKHEHVRRNSI